AVRSGDCAGGQGIVHPGNIVRDCSALTEGRAANMRGGAEQQQSDNDIDTFSHSAPTFAATAKSLNRRIACNPVGIRGKFSVGERPTTTPSRSVAIANQYVRTKAQTEAVALRFQSRFHAPISTERIWTEPPFA